jgi:ATP-dependent phosphofructokinase / diphosphate-dependent phosphofructokinase
MAKPKTRTFGILTSGGDCPGLNAAIRGVAKSATQRFDMNVIGISNGFRGLIENDARLLRPDDFSGILTLGGTILGTSREKPFKETERDSSAALSKAGILKDNYRKLGLDCLVVLGGNGTHKTAYQLQKEGLNVIGLPKTIDNDIQGTDVSFGFASALDVASEAIDRLHTTANSHNRIMVIEVMGHRAGWLALSAGLAAGGDIILIPEIPYDFANISSHLMKRYRDGKKYAIVVVAEGAVSAEEAKEKEKRRKKDPSAAYRVAAAIEEALDLETRVTVLGYVQRGGSPSPQDRLLATRFGTQAAKMMAEGDFGKMVALKGDEVTSVGLDEPASKARLVPTDHPLIESARLVGTCFGDE